MLKYVLLGAVIMPAFLMSNTVSAAEKSITLPISAKLLQCGKKEEIFKTCQKDSRCCVFLDRKPTTIEVAESSKTDLVPVTQR